ncbi:MAG: glutamine--tRNA ligase/YqeY domain fusion protein [Archangium sp.]|nr:glutamine--tRNA ligase/YqeY domain fusion protein [Archangium sp.]
MSSGPNFIEEIVEADNASGKWKGKVHTRFPPEPNGYLHVGHAKSIILNAGLATKYGGKFNLRFDDTNPAKEEQEYVDSIISDVKWLGGDFEDRLFYASDYFDQMYVWAEKLIEKGVAYVCDLPPDEMSRQRTPQSPTGTLLPGIDSPFRNRSVTENLDLFRRMKKGEFAPGKCVLRAKIDMASGNINLRDPVMYRIVKEHHHRQGDKWCIYASYDWAHGLEDSIEGITHSICTLEFENHRPLYDWFLDQLGIHHPQQIEFAKLLFTHTILSKRNLRRMVADKIVAGWDDPRMPTIAAFRRRGYRASALRTLIETLGVTKNESVIDIGRLEEAVRNDLASVPRRMAVLDPIKVVITNYPAAQVEQLELDNHPKDTAAGKRSVPFSRELYVDRDDFMEAPTKDFFRLGPGREVRLRGAYWIKCENFVKGADGKVIELQCTYDPATRGGENPPDGRKVKGTIHWVSAAHALTAEVRVYERLFAVEAPGAAHEDTEARPAFMNDLNPESLIVRNNAKLEPLLGSAKLGDTFQFERLGYFNVDLDSKPQALVFNRTMSLNASTPAKENARPVVAAPAKPAKSESKPAAAAPTPPPSEIEFGDFTKVVLKAGKVKAAEKVEKADKLLKLTVDLGEAAPRTIVSGIAEAFAPDQLIGRNVVVVTNLKPRALKGIESRGMILAAGSGKALQLINPGDVVPGSDVK